MMLLRLISWPYVRKHLLRSILTTLGIVLGVAVFVGMHTANQSVLYAFNRTVDKIAGATELQVSAGEIGFEEEILERVQAHPGVRVAVPVIEAPVKTGISGLGNLLILGVDLTGDRSLRDYDLEEADDAIIEDPLVFLAQPDSLIVSETFIERTGLKLNGKVTMTTMQGPKQFTIRGVMKSGGLASAFGGNLAIMDVYAAQYMFGRGRRFDRIDLAVEEGRKVEDIRKSLQAALGPGLMVDPPSSRGQQFEAMAVVFSMTANITSIFALFIGMFLIYNTFSIAVTQRRTEIGVLRALGATRRQVKGLFVLESTIAGLLGSAAGLAIGIWVSRYLMEFIGGMFGEIYGVQQRAEEITANPALLVGALLLGIVTSVIAGWIPARNAASIDPVKALQKGRVQVIGAGENRARRYTAASVLVASIVCMLLGHGPLFFYLGYMLSVIAVLLLTPTLCDWLARALRPVMKALRPVEGALAADSLLQAPRRTSSTVLALALSLALVIALGGVSVASYEAIVRWMNYALNPDLFVQSSENITQRTFRFPEEFGEEIRRVPGVEEAQAVYLARIVSQGTPVMLVAGDIKRLSTRIKFDVIEGDRARLFERVAEGGGVVISDNFSQLRGLHAGDKIGLMAPAGMLDLPVLGVVVDYSDERGTIMMDRDLFKQHWRDSSVSVFRVYLKPGENRKAIRDEMLRRFGDRTRLFILTNDEVREYVTKLTKQWFGLSYVQILVAVLVAILGIVNTLTVSIADRKRELGVLQAVGGLRNQIRHTIWMEALAIGALGLVIGYALGAVNLHYILEASRRDLSGWSVEYRYPVEIASMLIPVILGAAMISAIGPAEAAVRGSLVEALEYE